MKTTLLLFGLTAAIAWSSCGKDNKSKLVNTWTLKKVSVDGTYTSLLSDEIGHFTGENAAADSAHKITHAIEQQHEGTSYTLRADGTCTIKNSAGSVEAQWVYSVKPEKDVNESGLVRFTKDGKELGMWQFYGNDFKLAADCHCLNVLVSASDSLMKEVLGDATVVYSGSLHPASEDGLEHY